MQRSSASEIARSPDAWERIAKDWLIEVIERTPLDDLEGLPLAWMATQASPLIAEILGQLTDPGLTRELSLPPAARQRAASLASSREDEGRGISRELAALQSLIVEALGRDVQERDRGEFARTVSRLAEVFGAVQSAALEGLERERTEEAGLDPPSSLPQASDLHEWLRIMIAESRPTSRPFAIAQVEVDGTDRIVASYGQAASDRMVLAVAGILDAQKEPRDRVFRRGEGQLVLVRENADAERLAELASRLARTVDDSQSSGGPRVSVAIGVSSFPIHGDRPETLLDAAEEAAWAAAAAGDEFQVATGSLQDP